MMQRHDDGSATPPRNDRARARPTNLANEPLGHHVILRLNDNRVIAGTATRRRLAVCTMLRRGRARQLLACAIADTHAHAVLLCTRTEAGEFAGGAAAALHHALQLSEPFHPAQIRPIVDQRHLANAFAYVLRQDEHHGLASDGLHDGSNLPDLTGLRVVGAHTRDVLRRYLPRVSQRALLERFGIDWSLRHEIDMRLLIDASLAAVGEIEARGRKAVIVDARRAAARVAAKRVSVDQLAAAFGVDRRTVFRMRREPCDAGLVSAVALQLRLRCALQAKAAKTGDGGG